MTRKKRAKRAPVKRNPIARVVKKLRPQVMPDARRKKLAALRRREAEGEMGEEVK